jgi:hypothetical protein
MSVVLNYSGYSKTHIRCKLLRGVRLMPKSVGAGHDYTHTLNFWMPPAPF